MTSTQYRQLQALEGRRVHLALVGGDRVDDAALVSVRPGTVWIFSNGEDLFVPTPAIVDGWEARPEGAAA